MRILRWILCLFCFLILCAISDGHDTIISRLPLLPLDFIFSCSMWWAMQPTRKTGERP